MTTLQINLKAKRALTQFLNYGFNSIDLFNQEVLMASEDGLFKQGGDLDVAEDITAYFEILKTDFGIPNIKKLRFLYISYKSTEDLLLTLTTEYGGPQTFNIPANISGTQGYRLPVRSDLYGKYWTIKISNESLTTDAAGADFSINELRVLILGLVHGRNYN